MNVPLLGPTRRTTWKTRIKEITLSAYVLLLLGSSVYFLAAHKGLIAKPGWWHDVFGGAA